MKINMFSKTEINHQTIKNRIVRGATRDYLFFDDGSVSDDYIAIYEELAKNDVGLIISGVLTCDNRLLFDDPQGSVDGEQYIQGLSKVVNVVHQYDSIIYGQLGYPGKDVYETFDLLEMSEHYIHGAIVLKKAGFDGIEIMENTLHGENDEERLALPKNIIQGVKEACGKDFTVIMKVNANHFEVSKLVSYLQILTDLGLDAIEMCGRGWENRQQEEHSYFLNVAKKVKKQIQIPIILSGGLYSSKILQNALEEGMDFVSMCRPLICEPDFVQKLKNGNALSKCLRCSQCKEITPKTMYKRCVLGNEISFLKTRFS